MAYRILAIDDDAGILRLIKNALTLEGFEVTVISSLESIDLCLFRGYDLILLDVMMPVNGIDVCRAIRDEIKVPILFLTAKDLEEDVMLGIGAGADDYIKKPFSIKELAARVKMHLRREERAKGLTDDGISIGDLVIREKQQMLIIRGEEIRLTKREFSILSLLAENPGRTYSQEEIYERVYPLSSDTQFRSISEYVYQIRNKCKPYDVNPIETTWGGGYRWRKEEPSGN